jgi:hypothetical protein
MIKLNIFMRRKRGLTTEEFSWLRGAAMYRRGPHPSVPL